MKTKKYINKIISHPPEVFEEMKTRWIVLSGEKLIWRDKIWYETWMGKGATHENTWASSKGNWNKSNEIIFCLEIGKGGAEQP